MRDEMTWINPLGGLGDTLMLSGVLKLVLEHDPDRQYPLVRRTKYLPFLKNHPAISQVGHPHRDATLIGTDYWSTERYGQGGRAFQCLAEMFGLPLPVPEQLWLPGLDELNYAWPSAPPPRPRVIFAAGSDSPRKMWDWHEWVALSNKFRADGWSVIQTGKLQEPYIEGAFSLLGLTSPLELIALLKEVDLLVSADSFAMHAAKLVGTPAVILWGPTLPEVYGYADHIHVSVEKHCHPACIGPGQAPKYAAPCMESSPCMQSIKAEQVWSKVIKKSCPQKRATHLSLINRPPLPATQPPFG